MGKKNRKRSSEKMPLAPYGSRTSPLLQPNIRSTESLAATFRGGQMSPVRGMFFPDAPTPVLPSTTLHYIAEAPPSVNIAWQGHSPLPLPISTNSASGWMQPPGTNGIGLPSSMTLLPAEVPSTSMASLMPWSSVPGQTFTGPRTNGIGLPSSMTLLPAEVPSISRASVMPLPCVPDDKKFTGPGFRKFSPASGNFSPGTSKTVPSATAASSSIYGNEKVFGTSRTVPSATATSASVYGNEKVFGASKTAPSATATSSSAYGTLKEKTPLGRLMLMADSVKQLNKIQQWNDKPCGINSLPDDILLTIFGNLTQNKLGQIARVCKKWSALTRSPVLWKRVHVELYGHHRCQTEAARKFVSTLPPCVTYIRLDFMFMPGWARPLHFQKFCVWLQERCPQLEELFLKGADLTAIPAALVDLCTQFLQNVKSLTLRTVTFSDRRKMSHFRDTPKIEALSLYACDLKKCNDLQYLPMPLFKELDLTNTNIKDTWFKIHPKFFQKLEVLRLGFSKIGSGAFHIIQKNAHYLKELYVCGTNLVDRDLKFENSVFPQLRTICLTYCGSLTSAGIVSLIQSCQSLENVYVHEKLAKSCEEHPYFLLNRCKLEIVKPYSCFDHYPKSFYIHE